MEADGEAAKAMCSNDDVRAEIRQVEARLTGRLVGMERRLDAVEEKLGNPQVMTDELRRAMWLLLRELADEINLRNLVRLTLRYWRVVAAVSGGIVALSQAVQAIGRWF